MPTEWLSDLIKLFVHLPASLCIWWSSYLFIGYLQFQVFGMQKMNKTKPLLSGSISSILKSYV